jgi:hypothetical protein
MGFDASLPEPHIVKVLVTAQRTREATPLFAPLVKDLQLQMFRAITLPIVHLVKDLQLQMFRTITLPIVHIATGPSMLQPMQHLTSTLDIFARSQMNLAVSDFQRLAASGAFSVLSQQSWETLAGVAVGFRPLPAPTPRGLYEAEAELRSRLPVTPQQVQELEQAVDQVIADPQRRALVERAASGLGLTPRALAFMVVLTCVLFTLASLPLMVNLTPAQTTVLSNDIGVAAIIVGVVATLQTLK